MTDPTRSGNPLDWLLLLLLAMMGMLAYMVIPGSAVATSPATRPAISEAQSSADPVLQLAVPRGGVISAVGDVQVQVMESSPPQIVLQISGTHPDGCNYPVEVIQQRSGDSIYLLVYRIVPPDAFCTMMMQNFEVSIPLEGKFTPGETVNVTVNDYALEVMP
jgi:hypothetical protein